MAAANRLEKICRVREIVFTIFCFGAQNAFFLWWWLSLLSLLFALLFIFVAADDAADDVLFVFVGLCLRL